MDVIADLEARGLVHQTTDRDALVARLAEGPLTLYCGFDPTADSLGWWNLQNLITLRRFQEAGHRPIALAGGATGMIGDPSGRSEERVLLDADTLAANLAGITADLQRVLSFEGDNAATVVDNGSWTAPIGFIDFLRDVGKHVTVNQMVAKESVRSRMEGEAGMSYTEFSYMLLQANDFWWLHEHEGCELQIGGSDQWGNIVVGVDLIRRRSGALAHGLTTPLLVDATGAKIGKSTGGTVFMHPDRTSPYQFFQHWMQMPDAMVGELLAKFTFLSLERVAEVSAAHEAAPHKREGQRTLAREVTTLVHGDRAATAAERASEVLFGGDPSGAPAEVFEMLAREVPVTDVALDGAVDLVPLAADAFGESQSAVRRTLDQGGLYLNGERVTDTGRQLTAGDLEAGGNALIRLGKRRYHLVRTQP